jgi:hypothetical protein
MKFPGLPLRPAIALLTLTLSFLAAPGFARADLLVNDLSDRAAPGGVTILEPTRVAPAVAFGPYGPAAEEPAPSFDAGGLLALFGVCVHPPISDPGSGSHGSGGGGSTHGGGGGGGGTVIGSQGGGGSIASTSPEPGALLIGMIGASLAGLVVLARRRRLALLA